MPAFSLFYAVASEEYYTEYLLKKFQESSDIIQGCYNKL